MNHSLSNSALLDITTPKGLRTGGSQSWYPTLHQRRSGCGPVAASNLVWYISRAHAGLDSLCDTSVLDRDHFVALMETMFTFVTPGMRGVNTAAIFTDGIERYCASKGFQGSTKVLEFPPLPRPERLLLQAQDFVANALAADEPVAFLNLSNGSLNSLDNWHWVTILAMDQAGATATISDQGRTFDIALAQWAKTSLLGGAMVSLSVE